MNGYFVDMKSFLLLLMIVSFLAGCSATVVNIPVADNSGELRLKKQLKRLTNNENWISINKQWNKHCGENFVFWKEFANNFVKNSLGLKRQQTTTQIEHYDNLAALMDCIKRINNIFIDLSRDIWTYVSMDYFKQSIKKGEVGSSAMPHKVNPIDFENAEGNLGMANAIYEFLSGKLPISRLQRDLTDSTVLRNIGVPFSHNLIAFASLKKGLGKLVLNEEKIRKDLDNNWAVCAEAIQTILRRESYPNPYETLKDLTRTNSVINKENLSTFINGLDVKEEIKEELRKISPFNYTGI